MKFILMLLLSSILLAGCLDATMPQTPADLQIESAEGMSLPAGVAEPITTTNPATSPAPELDHLKILSQLLFTRSAGAEALAEIRTSGDTRFVAGLIDAMRYRRDLEADIVLTLNRLTGQNLAADWAEWVEWAGKHPEIESFEDYVTLKSNLFARIDPNFMRFVYPGLKVDPESRPEEIVWGGVLVDGIPDLDRPTMVSPDEATYLEPQERVFGVRINGDTRAYPARFLDWHEMFNDVVGGEPVSLAY